MNYVLPALNLTRLTDSEEVSYSHYQLPKDNVEVDAYLINDSGERLQLFLSNLVLPGEKDLLVSRKEYYDSLFLKTKNFLTKAIRNYLKDVQSGDPAAVIIKSLESADFQHQIDVVEIFLISNTISFEPRGTHSPKIFLFNDDEIKISYSIKGDQKTKIIKVKYQLIDLNKIYNFEISEGNSEPIVINFNPPLTAIKAADDVGLFESYLAVIPASLLVDFYHNYSSRLLERNVRSFLQFKGVNKQLKETIIQEPEKFIAYNNGLTITSTSSNIIQNGGVALINSLTDFQIVNGGQTTASIYFTSKDGVDVSKVNVIAKINVVKSEDRENLDDLISKISQYSNSQNKVSSVDLNSRSVHLVKIKKLSESITDPSGTKWFFERIRGEFNTLLRIYPGQKTQIEKNYPKHKRLSKEQIAKYYVAWGTSPYLVRKGGEKVFRDFMGFIQLDHNEKHLNPENLGRAFYEDLISKAIFFKEFEQLYGAGPNAIGQIRSSVVPYALSLLYKMTMVKKLNHFDLGAIWVKQGLPDDLKEFSKQLLQSVHEWLKYYSKSDDVGEYAKKEDLWKDLVKSSEVAAFEKNEFTKAILTKYRLSELEFKKRYISVETFDFSVINDNCRIHSNGSKFYNSLKLNFDDHLIPGELRKVEEIVQKLQVKHNLTEELVDFENQIIKKLQPIDPDWFLEYNMDSNNLINTIGHITNIYNKNLSRVKEAFEAETVKLVKKGISETKAISWKNVGQAISKNEVPLISDLYKIDELLKM
ncbi:AIPR family protein [Pedobacter gandavensis]|uniref:AIPR family protein n=1 Tax=Pedobacter gandavensis TaxID=2679963 RepID=UPI00292D4BF4|nr:AIPR family protein [Pedobacter gandavensis]